MAARLIINPAAGRGDQVERVIQLARQRAGWAVHRTEREGDTQRLAREAAQAGVELIVVAGGDDTLRDAINGIAEAGGGNGGDRPAAFEHVRLGIVPLGTGNDLARTLAIPWDADAALAVIDAGHERRIDLVRAHDGDMVFRYFLNAATGGFSERVHATLDPVMKRQWGALAYARAAAAAVASVPSYHVRLTLDDAPLEAESWCVIVANGRFAGGGVALAPTADPNDHLLDVIVITGESFLERLRVASQLALGIHLADEDVRFHRAAAVRVDADPPMAFTSDGDPIGRTPLTFQIVPAALRVLAPPKEER